MQRARRWFCWGILASLLVGGLAGCGGETPPSPTTRSKVQIFKDDQGATMTPHGKIRLESVQEVNGRIQYQTDEGKTWQVDMTKKADGTYQYGTPDEVR
jgi:hypothetical protein